MIKRKTLDEFRLSELRLYPNATGELSSLLREIALSAKRIQVEINRASALNNTEHETSINASGKTVKKLDRFANNEILYVLKNSFSCAGAVSEEEESIQVFDNCQNNRSKYVVMFDPVDGSSNIDNCMTLGTIFGIYRRVSPVGEPCEMQDFLQSGKSLAAAGYIIYGSSTMLVYATRRGVNGFTLDASIGEFTLTHPGIQCPETGNIYSVNESKILHYPDPVIRHIRGMQDWNLHNPGSFTSRYVGSMVADLHRTLLQGGIFLYPETKEFTGGKLRLMYECNPFAYIFEAAGGLASSGNQSIINIRPESIHQRSPVYIGSKRMVESLTRNNLKSFCPQLQAPVKLTTVGRFKLTSAGRFKEIFKLLFIEGLSTEEIGIKLGISAQTVRTQKARALQLIKSELLKKNLVPALLYLVIYFPPERLF